MIVRADLTLVDLKPLTVRTDAIQSFVSQETPLLSLTDSDGVTGTGYTYTIGSGGSSVVALLRDHLLPRLLHTEADDIEARWRELLFSVHALAVGPLTSLALAAVDTALWDLRCRRAGLPLHRAVGGAQQRVPLYATEGGWLQLSADELAGGALRHQAAGFHGAKIKVGRPDVAEDLERLRQVRAAVGGQWQLMVDANQSFTLDEARRRASAFEPVGLRWFEEPLPADDITAHATLARGTATPIAVGESLYSLAQFKDYLHAGACSVVQVDVARIGGITPWLKVAHLAEAYNVPLAPHFLMELHANLGAGVPNGRWIEYIPQLQTITGDQLRIEDGYAYPSDRPGLGIAWDWAAIADAQASQPIVVT